MLEDVFFALGLVSNLFLILVFLIRERRMDILRRVGPFYVLLSGPAMYGILLVQQEQKDVRYSIFLGIFLAFVVLEFVYDAVLNLSFRRNWKLLAPYLCLYFVMNYGFVVMTWMTSVTEGVLMLVLFVVQITLNIVTHPRKSKSDTASEPRKT